MIIRLIKNHYNVQEFEAARERGGGATNVSERRKKEKIGHYGDKKKQGSEEIIVRFVYC